MSLDVQVQAILLGHCFTPSLSVETGAIYQVEIMDGQLCNKHYQNGSSTGVLIEHLSSKHQITKGITKQGYVVRNKL